MEVIVNAAMSADGKLSSIRREQIAISGPEDFDRVDRLRTSVDAILVGHGTVEADDPSLAVDDGHDPHTPRRVVLDSRARTPPDARVLSGSAPTIIVTTERAPPSRVQTLRRAGATVITAGTERVDVTSAAAALADRGVESLLVEGGGEVIFSWFAAGLVDRLSVFVGAVIIGGRDAPTLVDGDGFPVPEAFPELSLDSVERLDEGVLLQWSVPTRTE